MLPHNFHDWYVARYEHRCSERVFILDLDPPGVRHELPMRVIFEGVGAVQLDFPWEKSIISEITDDERRWTMGLDERCECVIRSLDPSVVFLQTPESTTFDELVEALDRASLRFFEISTSYGLDGWIIAERASAAPRHDSLETTL
ncbi:MAG: hypothetical protein ACTS27_10135 [Phycisphaerales bacterium]